MLLTATMLPTKTTKRTLKYLAVCKDKSTYRQLLRSAPDAVVKRICDLALNAIKGTDVNLTPAQKRMFGKHRKQVLKLIDHKVGLKSKRALLQSGGFAWIPALVGALLGSFGTTLLGK
jgi:hypothetical protein